MSCCKSAIKEPIRVAVTGAAGQIGYSLLFRVVSGEMFGCGQPVILHLVEVDIPEVLKKAEGVKMEIIDCGYPLLAGCEIHKNVMEGFKDIDYAILVGASPRGAGETRADLLRKNGKIFEEQGKALDLVAKKTCKVFVVGNPANTNALIASHFAPSLPRENFAAMTRLDHNRLVGQLATRLGVLPGCIHNVTVFGNHADSMVPCVDFATIRCCDKEQPAIEVLKTKLGLDDEESLCAMLTDMSKTVKTRGSAIIAARGMSSAASAAKACSDAIRAWHLGTAEGEVVSMAVLSEVAGDAYGVKGGVCFSYPVSIKDGKWTVEIKEVSTCTMEAIRATEADLFGERAQAGL